MPVWFKIFTFSALHVRLVSVDKASGWLVDGCALLSLGPHVPKPQVDPCSSGFLLSRWGSPIQPFLTTPPPPRHALIMDTCMRAHSARSEHPIAAVLALGVYSVFCICDNFVNKILNPVVSGKSDRGSHFVVTFITAVSW